MRFIFSFILASVCFCCTREESNDSCSYDSLVTTVADARDMRKYVVQNNPNAIFGSARAIKSVTSLGEIEWIGNNVIDEQAGGLMLSNYYSSDWAPITDIRANLRDLIIIPIDLITKEKQVLLDKGSFAHATEVQAIYFRNSDDILESVWRVDSRFSNYVQITSIDSINMVAIGEFSISFAKDSIILDTLYADRVSFKCGTFKAKIE